MNARKRHIPMRSCVACGGKTPKRELLRIVATPEGGAQVDASGRMHGRGAYICPNCAADAGKLRQGRLAHSLRTRIDNRQWDKVIADISAHSEARAR